MNTNVLRAVFSRNLFAYFSNPTGYVFICVFVLLSSFAAFWPNEFFNANLANLDQLNRVFPFIMLIFIPAITMSVWAEERRGGTDELLLTIPARDFDIVLGKYLAAVAIYTVSLLFSLICNCAMLWWLSKGGFDGGLFFGAYAGYWLVGLAMLAVGMVASFLTANLTVGFILGAAFNVPLVFAAKAENIMRQDWARIVEEWSIGGQFADFGRGILSLSGIVYFVAALVVMLYLSMVLIGRRHWVRGGDRPIMALHYAVRTVSLVVLAVAASMFFQRFDVRVDATTEKLSSLAPTTTELLGDLEVERPIKVEAFISPSSDMPEMFVQTRLNLLSMLRELRSRGGGKIQVQIHNTELYSDEADDAETRFNIMPRPVMSQQRGSMSRDEIFMGVAIQCGLENVILPFIDRGIPIEYELVRSINTVSQQKRRRIGILQTDAQLYGSFNMQTMSSSQNWPIITELEKMYEVVQVDASSPITEEYDALFAVQPSSLGPDQMPNFIAAVRSGIPTAVFEDPFPAFAGNVPATLAERMPPGGRNPMMMMQRQQAPPKGDIGPLWDLLGVNFRAHQIIGRNHNPYDEILGDVPRELVFVDRSFESEETFNDEQEISSQLEMLLFPFPGSLLESGTAKLEFQPLVHSGMKTGYVAYEDMLQRTMFGSGGLNQGRRFVPTDTSYILAAHISGKLDAEETKADDMAEEAAKDLTGDGPSDADINVVVVADIDMFHGQFFQIREAGDRPDSSVQFKFDNVTFVLNVLDVLAGDRNFVEIRKRRPKHHTLARIDEFRANAAQRNTETRKEHEDQLEEAQEDMQTDLNKRMDKLREDMREKNLDEQEIARRFALALSDGTRRMQQKVDRLQRENKKKQDEIKKQQDREIRRVQDRYKMLAVFVPPIPPLVLAVIVFFTRRGREREGVADSRLR